LGRGGGVVIFLLEEAVHDFEVIGGEDGIEAMVGVLVAEDVEGFTEGLGSPEREMPTARACIGF
jgi:hypothetical protein